MSLFPTRISQRLGWDRNRASADTNSLSHVAAARTAQQTYSVSIIQTSQVMLRTEIAAVCSEHHAQPVSAARTISEC
jgi:hypothetical protein